jgi:hypothetical protein
MIRQQKQQLLGEVVFHFGVQVVFFAGNWGSCVFFLCGELGEVRHHDDFIGCVLVYA